MPRCSRSVIAVTLVTSACTTVGPLPWVDTSTSDNYPQVLQAVSDRGAAYSQHITDQTWQVGYNAAITLLAVGGVAVAVFSHGAARANLLAGIGLGAGAVATAWGWSNPSGANDAYRLGAYRISCLSAAAKQLDSTPITLANGQKVESWTSTQLDALSNANSALQADSDNLAAAVKAAGAPEQASDAKTSASISKAQTALQQVPSVQRSSAQELADFQQRSVIVYAALQKIDTQVYAVVKGAPINYAATYSSLMQSTGAPSAQTSAGNAGNPLVAQPGLIPVVGGGTSLDSLTASVLTDIQNLQGLMPFSPIVKQIGACASVTS